MGVYIKGMEKPAECSKCPIALSVCIGCNAFITGYRPSGKVRDDCPIKEIKKPHGRIIDESEIKTVYGRELLKQNNGYTIAAQRIDFTDAPTVIEAEDE